MMTFSKSFNVSFAHYTSRSNSEDSRRRQSSSRRSTASPPPDNQLFVEDRRVVTAGFLCVFRFLLLLRRAIATFDGYVASPDGYDPQCFPRIVVLQTRGPGQSNLWRVLPPGCTCVP